MNNSHKETTESESTALSAAMPPLTRREARAMQEASEAASTRTSQQQRIAERSRALAERVTARVNTRAGQISALARPAIFSRSAVLAVLAVTTVGGPVNALLRDGQQDVREGATEPVQHVVVSADGSFVVGNPAAGVEAFTRDSVASSRTEGRETLTDDGAESSGAVAQGEVADDEATAPEGVPSDTATAADAGADEPTGAATESVESAEPSEEASGDEQAAGSGEAEGVVDGAEDSDESVTDPDFMGDPTDEGGIPVDEDQLTGSDFPGEPLPGLVEIAPELAPQVNVDATAVWTSDALVADGTAAIGVRINLDRLDLLERAQQILDESEGQLDDPDLRNAVAVAVVDLEAANDEGTIAAASANLDGAIGELRTALSSLNAEVAMSTASANARAALAAGRAYNPSERLDFGMTGWAHPAPSGRSSSAYGYRGYVAGSSAFHNGVDFAAPVGTPIRVAADGVVTYVGHGHSGRGMTGWVIIVAHGNGLETSYNHMYASGVYVSEGEAVRAGDVIGGIGNTGRSTGPHLHLSVWQDGQHVNPSTFFSERGVSLR